MVLPPLLTLTLSDSQVKFVNSPQAAEGNTQVFDFQHIHEGFASFPFLPLNTCSRQVIIFGLQVKIMMMISTMA